MAIRTTDTPECRYLALDGMDDWREFMEANAEAIADAYGDEATALRHARDGGLELGGGAAPLVLVYFEDAPHGEIPHRGIVAY